MKRPTFLKYSRKRFGYRPNIPIEKLLLLSLFLKDMVEKLKIIKEVREKNLSIIKIIEESCCNREFTSDQNKTPNDLILAHEKMCQTN